MPVYTESPGGCDTWKGTRLLGLLGRGPGNVFSSWGSLRSGPGEPGDRRGQMFRLEEARAAPAKRHGRSHPLEALPHKVAARANDEETGF
ncbi:hypothetical protein AGIG_G1670 [Arapaima gigas]